MPMMICVMKQTGKPIGKINKNMTREINQKDWTAFCQLVSEKYQGAQVNLQLINSRVENIAQGLPLQGLRLNPRTDACSDHLVIEAGGIQHEILDPIRLILRKPTGQEHLERFHALEIPAENGTTVLTLHPGIAAEDLSTISDVSPAQQAKRVADHDEI